MGNCELFFKLQKIREDAATLLEKRFLRGVQYSVVEKYSEQAHFVYELLQNADDVKATKVRFVLEKDGLIFIHNGEIKFNITDPDDEEDETRQIGHINAITSIGYSSKSDIQIGKFGLGFKSVFQYTKTPQIYEDDFKFKIERFIVPGLLDEDHELRKQGETLFYFPFNNLTIDKEKAYSDISEKFQDLENPLMFIKHLKSIEWETLESQGSYSKKTIKKEDWNNSTVVTLETTKDNLSEQFLTFTETIPSNEQFKITLAFQLENSQIVAYDRFPAYCFFPTKENTNLKFIIQAPFLLIDNRQGIKRGDEWNILLVNQLSDLLVKSLDYFIENKLITDDFFNALPIESEFFNEKSFFYPFYHKTKFALLEKAIFPTKENALTDRFNAYIGDNEKILTLLSSEQLGQLFNNDAQWIFPTLTGSRRRGDILGSYLFEEIEIRELTPRSFIKNLTLDFLEKQKDNEEWLINFYKYVGNLPNLYNDLRLKPIIKTTEDKLIAPFNLSQELSVFLPSSSADVFTTVKDIFIQDEVILKFFKQLGIEKPNLKSEIELKVIPQYKQGSISFEENLQFISLFITLYEQLPSNEQRLFISKIKDLDIIEMIDNLQDERHLTKGSLVYYSTNELRTYFYNYTERINWLSSDFYTNLSVKHSEEIITEFLSQLQVAKQPRLLKKPIDINSKNKKKRGLRDISVTYQYSIIDYEIEGLEAAVNRENLNIEKSKVIWNFLSSNSNYLVRGSFSYFYRSHKQKAFDAEHIKLLRESAWLYPPNSNQPKLPRGITIGQLANNGYNLDNQLNERLFKWLNIKNETSPIGEIDWNDDDKKLEFFEKAQKYDEYADYINNIPEDKLKQLLKEQQIIEARGASINNETDENNNKSTSNEDSKTNDVNYLTKQDIAEEFKNIRNQIDNDIETDLETFQKKLEAATIVESEEQKILYANLMSLRDFAIELSHVIKTALSKVISQAEFFKDNYPDEDYANLYLIYAEQMHYEVQRLKTVVKFMLDYTEAEKYYTDFSVVSEIKYAFNYLHKDDLEKENIFIELDLEQDLTLHYNKKSFDDVLSNLITNSIKALKATKQKRIKCSTSLNDETKELIIILSDNGYGIDEKIKSKIFNVYFTTTQEHEGAGVGLYIVKMKLKTLGGYIEVIEPEMKQGASFKIGLPLN